MSIDYCLSKLASYKSANTVKGVNVFFNALIVSSVEAHTPQSTSTRPFAQVLVFVFTKGLLKRLAGVSFKTLFCCWLHGFSLVDCSHTEGIPSIHRNESGFHIPEDFFYPRGATNKAEKILNHVKNIKVHVLHSVLDNTYDKLA